MSVVVQIRGRKHIGLVGELRSVANDSTQDVASHDKRRTEVGSPL
jgi:hypothetical protein